MHFPFKRGSWKCEHSFKSYLNPRRSTYEGLSLEGFTGMCHCFACSVSCVFLKGCSGFYRRFISWPNDILSLIKSEEFLKAVAMKRYFLLLLFLWSFILFSGLSSGQSLLEEEEPPENYQFQIFLEEEEAIEKSFCWLRSGRI